MMSVFPPRVPSRGRRRASLSALLLGGLVTVGLGLGLPRPAPAAPAPATAPSEGSGNPGNPGNPVGPRGFGGPDNPIRRGVEGARTFRDVQTDISEIGQKLGEAMQGKETSLFDPDKRKEVKPKVLPLLKKMSDLFDEGVKLQPLAEGPLSKPRMEVTAMRAILDDPDAATLLRKMTVSTDADEANAASAWEILVTFAHAGKDAEAQKKSVATLEKVASLDPENGMIAQVADLMSESAATPEVADQVTHLVTDVLKGPLAARVGAQMVAEQKLRNLQNKPLTVSGTTVDGKPFSTAAWKGKVVMVDFWATWCGPCLQELPHVKKVYDTYHAKGLEIVGVSCDTDKEDLKNFLTANDAMTWPQLFDDKAAIASKFHPLAEEYGVQGIPTIFLIDKKGVLRTAKGREQMDELIPKLLAEKE